jgi:hypothetical protein
MFVRDTSSLDRQSAKALTARQAQESTSKRTARTKGERQALRRRDVLLTTAS